MYNLIVPLGGVCIWVSWILCSTSHQTEIKVPSRAVILSEGWGSSFKASRRMLPLFLVFFKVRPTRWETPGIDSHLTYSNSLHLQIHYIREIPLPHIITITRGTAHHAHKFYPHSRSNDYTGCVFQAAEILEATLECCLPQRTMT